MNMTLNENITTWQTVTRAIHHITHHYNIKVNENGNNNTISTSLRNRLPVGGGCVYVLQLFFCFFFFSVHQNYETTAQEWLKGFS